MLSLRPQGQHAPLRVAAARAGAAATVALPAWRLQRCDTAESRRKLRAALAADSTLFTSPAAVAAAAALLPDLPAEASARWLAVGEGTLRALHRAGAHHAQAPSRMDSEGLLAMPALQTLAGRSVGLVTAPGGRGLIAATLQQRGAQVHRADVYQRLPLRLPPRSLARLSRSPAPWILALSSSEALHHVWRQLGPAWQDRWRQQLGVVAASARLQQQALDLGLQPVRLAAGPLPAQLAAAAALRAAEGGWR